MNALKEAPDAALTAVRVLLTDVDGTLTRGGKLPADVMVALTKLDAAGIAVVPVTGRPAGWAHQMMHHWPVRAAVAENGALAFIADGERIETVFALGETASAKHRADAMVIAENLIGQVPGTALAGDQPYRRVDVAIDHAEAVTPLTRQEVARLRDLAKQAGATMTVSSIHAHVQLAKFDKAAMAKRVLNDYLGCSDLNTVCAVGDAPNDEPLFETFPLSVGVANIAAHTQEMTHLPRYITGAAEADGFCELAARLLAARA